MPRINFELSIEETESLLNGGRISLGALADFRDVAVTGTIGEFQDQASEDCEYSRQIGFHPSGTGSD